MEWLKTQKDFMEELQKCLSNHFNQEDRDEILLDYEMFFKTGVEEGKTEAELCLEFGSPKEIVKALKREEPQKSIRNRIWKKIDIFSSNIFILLIGLAAGIFFFLPCSQEGGDIIVLVLFLMGVCGLLWNKSTGCMPNRKLKIMQFIFHSCILFFNLGLSFFLLYQSSHFILIIANISYAGLMLSLAMKIIMAADSVMILYGLWKTKHSYPYFLPVICHGMGGLLFYKNIYITIHSMDLGGGTAFLGDAILFSFKIYGIGIVMAAACFIILRLSQKRGH